MSYPASLIAAAFVKKAIDEGTPVTQMKLQKMVYFAHGYHLAKTGEPLVKEKFQAWKFGPVVPAIYDSYKFYGKLPISDTEYVKGSDTRLSALDQDAIEAIDYTWAATKPLSAADLSTWTHQPGSPWASVYSEYDWATPISDESIQSYFKDFLY